MPLASAVHRRPIDYFILSDPRPTGPKIGLYADREVPESVVDVDSRHYVYAGIAPHTWNGHFNVDALKPCEFILQPGLVYRLVEPAYATWFGSMVSNALARLPIA